MYGSGGGIIGGGGTAAGGTLAFTGASDPFPALAIAVGAIIIGGLLMVRTRRLQRQQQTGTAN